MIYKKAIEEINEALKKEGPIDNITLQYTYDYGEDSSNTVTKYKEVKFGRAYTLGSGDVILNELFNEASHILEKLEDETGIAPDEWEDGTDDDYRFLELLVIEIKFLNGTEWEDSDLNYINDYNYLLDD